MKPTAQEVTMENPEVTETPAADAATDAELERLRSLAEWPYEIPEGDEYV